jgi:hypothetical protein
LGETARTSGLGAEHQYLAPQRIRRPEETYGNDQTMTKFGDLQTVRPDMDTIVEATTNLNSSGQGFDDSHKHHPLHSLITKHGFQYSHSTPIHQGDGSVHVHHTYQAGEHKIGVEAHSQKWESKVSSASGHSTQGVGVSQLDQHLTNKKKRYPELRQL